MVKTLQVEIDIGFTHLNRKLLWLLLMGPYFSSQACLVVANSQADWCKIVHLMIKA